MLKSKEDYKLIPIDEINDEAIELAVLWSIVMVDDSLKQKHKLASDIMNYAKIYHEQHSKNTIQLIVPEGFKVGDFTEKIHVVKNTFIDNDFIDIKIQLIKNDKSLV